MCLECALSIAFLGHKIKLNFFFKLSFIKVSHAVYVVILIRKESICVPGEERVLMRVSQDRQCTYNVTLRHVRECIVAVEEH